LLPGTRRLTEGNTIKGNCQSLAIPGIKADDLSKKLKFFIDYGV